MRPNFRKILTLFNPTQKKLHIWEKYAVMDYLSGPLKENRFLTHQLLQNMTILIRCLLLCGCLTAFFACDTPPESTAPTETSETADTAADAAASFLIFSKTNGYRHASIETGQETLNEIAEKNGWTTTVTEDSLAFTTENLAKYTAVIFLSTTGDVLGTAEEAAFENYINNGGGYFGIHAAADTEYDWEFYNELVGAYFESHPNDPNIRQATVNCTNKDHISTKMLPETWVRNDEWYNYKSIRPNLKVLLTLDESTYEGGTNGDFHPIAWYHTQGEGRAIYTGGGHTPEAFGEELFVKHLEGAMKYAIGK